MLTKRCLVWRCELLCCIPFRVGFWIQWNSDSTPYLLQFHWFFHRFVFAAVPFVTFNQCIEYWNQNNNNLQSKLLFCMEITDLVTHPTCSHHWRSQTIKLLFHCNGANLHDTELRTFESVTFCHRSIELIKRTTCLHRTSDCIHHEAHLFRRS